MIFLIVTLCSSAAMTDCQLHQLGQFETVRQCEVVAGVHREVLGDADNYRLECVSEDE